MFPFITPIITPTNTIKPFIDTDLSSISPSLTSGTPSLDNSALVKKGQAGRAILNYLFGNSSNSQPTAQEVTAGKAIATNNQIKRKNIAPVQTRSTGSVYSNNTNYSNTQTQAPVVQKTYVPVITSKPAVDEVKDVEDELNALLIKQSKEDAASTLPQDIAQVNTLYDSIYGNDEVDTALETYKQTIKTLDAETASYAKTLETDYERNKNLIKEAGLALEAGITTVNYERGNTRYAPQVVLQQIKDNSVDTANKLQDLASKQQKLLFDFTQLKRKNADDYFDKIRTIGKEYSANKKILLNEVQESRKQQRNDQKLLLSLRRDIATEQRKRQQDSISVAKVVAEDVADEIESGRISFDTPGIVEAAQRVGVDPNILAGYVQSVLYKRGVQNTKLAQGQARVNQGQARVNQGQARVAIAQQNANTSAFRASTSANKATNKSSSGGGATGGGKLNAGKGPSLAQQVAAAINANSK